MVDRDDDLRIGVKSTAILFAEYDNKIIALLQIATLAILVYLGWNSSCRMVILSVYYRVGLFYLSVSADKTAHA